MKVLRRISVFILTVSALNIYAAPTGPVEDFIKASTGQYEKIFQDLHQYPELSFKETRTAAKVAKHLRAIGFTVTENFGQTGVVGIYRNGNGPTVAIRADMDALPITEETGLPYASKNAGVMHACGHDFHTTAALAVADLLVKQRTGWRGTILYIGQPAEEIVSGAQAMLDAGLYTQFPRPDAILALHTSGSYEAGEVRMKPGFQMAANDSFDLTLFGKGTHGARPHLGIDPLALLTEFKTFLDQVIAREISALDAAVVTMGKVTLGTKRNIIADSVKAEGLVRTFSPDVRNLIMQRIKEIAEGVSSIHHSDAPVLTWVEHSDVVGNDPHLHDTMKEVFTAQLGPALILPSEQTMTAEDFGQFNEGGKIPSLFYFIGTRAAGAEVWVNHNSKFAIDFRPAFHSAVTTMANGVMKLAQ